MNSRKAIVCAALFAGAWLFVVGPAQARFLQSDPVGYGDDLDLYTYVHNDPVNGVDPTGLEDASAVLYGAGVGPVPGYYSTPSGEQEAADSMDQAASMMDAAAASLMPLDGVGTIPEEGAVLLRGAAVDLRTEAAETRAAAKAEKTFQTYTKEGPNGEKYTGHTSGTGTPRENVAARDRGHHMNDKGFGPAKLDKSSSNPQAIRGREQQMIDMNGGAQSQGGTSGNKINGIAPNNPQRAACMKAATGEFGCP